ncbi:MAG: hypothetical protein ACF8XB_13780, partial [Planctomycetota bacterium JB042]
MSIVRRLSKREILPLLAAALLTGASSREADAADTGAWSDEFDLPGLPGRVWGVGTWNGQLVAGGTTFLTDGRELQHVALWDGEHWQPVGGGVNGDVRALVEYQGDLVVAGSFGIAGGTPASGIARFDGNTWNALGAGLDLSYGDPLVFDLAVYQGDLYAAGWFDRVGSSIQSIGVARWDGGQWHAVRGGVTGPWEPKGLSLHVGGDGALYLGGEFSHAGNVPCANLARWDGVQWTSVGGGLPGPVGTSVFALEEFQGKLVAGGNLQLAGTMPVEKIAAFDGNTWSSLGGGIPDSTISTDVYSLQTFQGSLFVGGDFSSVEQADGTFTSAPKVARWDGAQWSYVGGVAGSDLSTTAIAMTIHDQRLVVGGEFSVAGDDFSVGGPVVSHSIAAYDGAEWHGLGKGLGTGGFADMLRWRGKLVVLGGFLEAGGNYVSRLAVLEDGDWQPIAEIDGNLDEAIVFQDDLIVTGSFQKIDGQPMSGTARYDGSTWTSMFGGGGTFEIHQGTLYAAGLGQPRRWNGSSWETFGGSVFGQAYDLQSYNGKLYLTGSYVSYGHLLAWDGNSFQTVAGGLNGSGYALAVHDGDLIVGGTFTQAGGAPAHRIARYDGQSLSAFNASLTGQYVRTLEVLDGDLYAGGDLFFNWADPRKGLARYDGAAWQAVGGGVQGGALALYGDELEKRLYVGGGFFTVGDGIPAHGTAGFDLDTPWTNLGHAKDGLHGPPALWAVGTLPAGTEVELHLDHVLDGSIWALIAGTSAAEVPFLGGTLIPAPGVVAFPLPTGSGRVTVATSFPTNVPSAVQLFLQAWIVDPSVSNGHSASNGVTGV